VSLGLGERFTAVPGPRALLAFSYLVVFGSMVAFSAYTYLLHRVRPALATSNSYVNPLVAVLLGCLLGGEHFALGAAVAMAAILAGVALVVAGNRGRNSGEPAP
jgi:drug/metabolite transporter (DMT)-like permease